MLSWADVAKPAKCTCAQMVLATLEETLACPRRFLWVPGTEWVHVPRWWR